MKFLFQVTSSDPGLVKVLTPENQADNTLSYPIQLQLSKSLWDRYQLEADIEIGCSLTGQEKKIPVRVKLVAPKGDNVPSCKCTQCSRNVATSTVGEMKKA